MVDFLSHDYVIESYKEGTSSIVGVARRKSCLDNNSVEEIATEAFQNLLFQYANPSNLNYKIHNGLSRAFGSPLVSIVGHIYSNNRTNTINIEFRKNHLGFNLQGPQSKQILEHIVR